MSKLLSVFGSIRLTLTQWVLISMATMIGGLVLALRLQGSRLHKAQVELLGQHLDGVLDKDFTSIDISADRYARASQAYKEAKKRGQG